MHIVGDNLEVTLPARWAIKLARRWFGTQVAQAYTLTLLTPAF
jgi:hypothetical protein